MAIKIYIDQGHNPVNPNAGAEGNGYREQDVVYTVGQELAALLRADGNFEVKLSRPAPDTQLGYSTATSLAARTEGANTWGADWFISLHTNAAAQSTASGSEAYVYAAASRAYALAEQMLAGLQEETGLRDRGVFSRPSLYVLRRTDMPAVLMELGFITNPFDARLMVTEPQRFARGLYNGIRAFFGL